jgi:hypothetical protein
MSRVHTAAAALLVAGVVLVPLGFWVYARAASVDRGPQVAHARRLLTDVAPPPLGARSLDIHVYEQRAWEGENLVPVSSYTVETAYRLRRPLRASRIVAHYRRKLRGWTVAESSPAGVRFVRGDDTIDIDIVEYRDASGPMRSYGVIVSQ